jgi:flagellar biosynthesis protein FlhB
MSRREMDDERRESEGDPHLHAERKRRAREVSAQTALMQLSEACMLVHDGADHAVALRLGPGPNAAPQVWIKVQGQAAQRARHAAVERALAVYVDAPLTAALLKLETTEPIPPALYSRVAKLLAQQRSTAP